MNVKPWLIRAALGSTLFLAACGGGGTPTPNPNPNPNPNPDPGGTNAIRDRLVACPVVMQSSDPAASACLAGSYSGKTLSGENCTLVVQAGGNYQYTSPALAYSYTATAKTIRVFGHQNLGGLHQVIWLISDPVQLTDAYDLDFKYSEIQSKKLEIQATKRFGNGGSVSSTCTTVLN